MENSRQQKGQKNGSNQDGSQAKPGKPQNRGGRPGTAAGNTKKPQVNPGQQAAQAKKGPKKGGYAGNGSTVKEMPELAGRSVEDTLARLIREKGREAGPEKREANKENRKGPQNDEQTKAAAKRAKEASRVDAIKNEQTIEFLKEIYTPQNGSVSTKPMPILKLYPSFARPEFYQPPHWRYRREGARGQNPKQKNCELVEAAKTLKQPPAINEALSQNKKEKFSTEEQKGGGSSGAAPQRAQPAATKKRLIPAGQASGQRHYQGKEDSSDDDHKRSDWEDDDSEDGEFLDLDDVIFGRADQEDQSASSSINSIDKFEIDDSFLDVDDEDYDDEDDDDYKADRGEGRKIHNTRSTGRAKGVVIGKKPKIQTQNQPESADVQGKANPNYDIRKKKEARHRLLAKKLKGYHKQEQEIFREDFDPAKARTVKAELYGQGQGNRQKQKKQRVYANTASRGYEEQKLMRTLPEQEQPTVSKYGYRYNDSDSDSESDDEVAGGYRGKQSGRKGQVGDPRRHEQSRPGHQRGGRAREFDGKKEKQLSNKVFSQGQNKQDHRQKEREAKENRSGGKPGGMNRNANRKIFQEHLTDEELIKTKLAKGYLFQGIIRFNPKFRQRAFLTVSDLKVDIMIEGQAQMNRALDGDTVLVALDPVKHWQELQSKHQATSNGNSKVGYSNDKAIETRTVDAVATEGSIKELTDAPKEAGDRPKAGIQNQEITPGVENNFNDCDKQEVTPIEAGTKAQQKQVDHEGENKGDEKSDEDGGDSNNSSFKLTFGEPVHSGPAVDAQITKNGKRKRKEGKADLKEPIGTLEQRIKHINELSQTHRPQGVVVGITESPNRDKEQMCTLIPMSQGEGKGKNKKGAEKDKKSKDGKEKKLEGYYAVPVNAKLPWHLLTAVPPEVEEDKKAEKKVGHRYYIAKFTEWTAFRGKPTCKITESIGEAGNLDAESMRLLRTYDICTEAYEDENQEPTSNVDECLKIFAKDIDPETKEWIIPESEIAQRLDLRSKRIFTIDPLTAKDLDDALSIDKISDHIYEIGVHIADVSYFVTQGTSLDHEAQKRCTSTYFVHRVYPMLPRLLCERLCSLNPLVDRLAYSIFFRMDIRDGTLDETHQPRIQRSVIRSCAKWHYGLVQQILNREIMEESQLPLNMKPQGQTFEDMVSDCFLMNGIAQKRRDQRLEAGSVMFMNREFNFTLDKETKYPVGYNEAEKMQSKSLVEEYMLMANVLVAKYLFKYCKDKTVLRAHNDISGDKKERLQEFFGKVGVEGIDLTNAQTLSKSMERLKQSESKETMNVLNRKFLTCLTQAKYLTVEEREPAEYLHYGLNFPIYTHFTSPIRRYADLLVHRLLTISLKEQEKTREMIEAIDYAAFADLCSEKSLNARKAGRDCQRLFHCLLLKEQGPRAVEALLFDLDAQSISLYIEEINIHTTLKLKDDPRIESTEFFGEGTELAVACSFPKPQVCAEGLKNYVTRKAGAAPATGDEEKKEPLSNICFKVYDKVKIKVETTTDFPLDLKCTLVITQADGLEYERITQEAVEAELAQANQKQAQGELQVVADADL